MGLKYKIFDGTGTYMTPSGAIATAETIRQNYPAVNHFTHVLELNGPVLQAVMQLDALRNLHDIDPELSDEEALIQLEYIRNNPPEPAPTVEERIAAALEFQSMMLIPTEEE